MALVEVKNITKNFGNKPILKNVSISINKGEIYTIIGPSGSGKSTLLRIIDLLEKPSSGKVIFDNQTLHSLTKNKIIEMRRRMALVFQKPVLFNMNVFDNIAYGLNIRKVKWDVVKEKTKQAMEDVRLSEFEKENALVLSGGEAQRVALARALVIEPEVLLLDEPTANLDPSNVALIEEIIIQMNKKLNTTIIMATHNMLQAKRLGMKVGFLLEGELVEEESADNLFNKPKHPKTRDFIEGKMIY